MSGGARVSDIGCGPTPMLYYAGMALQADGAIQVTGSHNPPDHNGFKMVMNGTVFFGDDIQKLGKICANGPKEKPGGSLTKTPVFDSYINRLVDNVDTGNYTVVWDCGNRLRVQQQLLQPK